MKIGSLRMLCTAAVAAALSLPAFAQQGAGTRTSEGGTRQSPNGARGAEGEAGTVRPATGTGAGGATRRTDNSGQTAGAGGTAVNGRDPASGRATRPDSDDIAIPGALDDSIDGATGTRTANFPPEGRAGATGGDRQRGQLNDRSLVRWISAGNEAEIQINEVARQQAQNDQVKQFADRMVEEHTQLAQKLRQAAQGGNGAAVEGAESSTTTIEERTGRRSGAAKSSNDSGEAEDDDASSVTGTDNSERSAEAAIRRNSRNSANDGSVDNGRNDEADRNAAEEGGSPATIRTRTETRTPGAGGTRRGNNLFIVFHEEIKRQCAQSTIADLKQKQGAEFDKCFINQQIVEHMGMLDTLKVAQQHASESLRPALQEAEKHTQQHLQQAKDIAKQLENQNQRQ